jgi:hypothetical protein
MKTQLFGTGKLNFFAVMFFVLVTVFLVLGDRAMCHASGLSLEYSSGRLSADVSKCTVQKALDALSKKCGITVFMDSSLKSKTISAKFDKLPLEEAVKKLVNPYSSAVIFAKRVTPGAGERFYISELKVFDSSNKNTSYILVGKKTSDHKDKASISKKASEEMEKANKVVSIPEEIKDTAKAASFNKKVSYSVIRTRITQKMSEMRQLQQRMKYEEEQKRRQIQLAREKLNGASGRELDKIGSEISMFTVDLKNTKNRNDDQLNKLQRDLDQLKHRIVQQENS